MIIRVVTDDRDAVAGFRLAGFECRLALTEEELGAELEKSLADKNAAAVFVKLKDREGIEVYAVNGEKL